MRSDTLFLIRIAIHFICETVYIYHIHMITIFRWLSPDKMFLRSYLQTCLFILVQDSW